MRTSTVLLLACAVIALSGRTSLTLAAEPGASHPVETAKGPPRLGKTLARILLFLPRKMLGLASSFLRLLRTGKWSSDGQETEAQFPFEEAKQLVNEASSAAQEAAHAAHEVVEEAYREVKEGVHEAFETMHHHAGETSDAEIIEEDHHHHDDEEE